MSQYVKHLNKDVMNSTCSTFRTLIISLHHDFYFNSLKGILFTICDVDSIISAVVVLVIFIDIAIFEDFYVNINGYISVLSFLIVLHSIMRHMGKK